ncbi:efflux pump antibiotic resistance protein [Chaetomium sp. MPI-CAGE-AT-0009]|nr:efflux pump antibiotic resistance protein [Chaetomium sp. MPI-CAGE-AT-0009]
MDTIRDPKSFSWLRKWLMTVIVSCCSLCATCTSSIYASTYRGMEADFHSSDLVATSGITVFLIGTALSSTFVAPLSELYGRRPIYVVSYLFFIIWFIPSAVATNIETVLIGRLFNGVAGGAVLSVAGGTLRDIFEPRQLQTPMAVFSAAPFMGATSGPIIGGFINYYSSTWRWTYYVLIIWSGVLLLLVLLCIPETYPPVLLRQAAQRRHRETPRGRGCGAACLETDKQSVSALLIDSIRRPFMILFLDPMCFCLCLLSSVVLGILYLFFNSFTVVFAKVYGFNLWQTGLAFLGILTGMMLAVLSNAGFYWNYARLLRKNGMIAKAEYRIIPSIVGAWLCVVGLFIFAWTAYPSIHWIAPIIGTALFGLGSLLVFTGVFTFLVEAFPLYAASALGANTFARSIFSGAFPLFSQKMYDSLGIHWGLSLLGFLALLVAPFPYIFYVFGPRLQEKSRFGSKR